MDSALECRHTAAEAVRQQHELDASLLRML
jgi:hypothetical protein